MTYTCSVRKAFRSWILPISFLAAAFISASAMQFLTPRLENVAIDGGGRRLENVPFPFLREMSAGVNEYRITGDIERKPYQFTTVTLLPTSCLSSLRIDRQSIALPSGYCREYDVRLPPGPRDSGSHLIYLDATVSTNFPIFGLTVRAPASDPLTLTLRLLACAGLATGLYLVVRRCRFDRTVSLILLGTLPVQLLYFFHTPAVERTYDVLGHIQHVEFIANQAGLPPSNYCHECYQPSLYYVTAAVLYWLAQVSHIFDPMAVLQFYSLAWFWLFLVMSARIVLLWLPRDRERYLAIALLAFWPGGFLHSSRISNDIPLYALFATGLYFVLSWWKSGRRNQLMVAAIVAGLGILIKATMLVLAGTIGILILCRIYSRYAGTKPRLSYAPPVLVMAASVVLYIGQSALKGGVFLPVWLLLPSMYVGNSWKQYLFLNTTSYFRSPFINSTVAGTGREYFWNYVFKSSMFGDYEWWPKQIERNLALVMGPLLLLLVLLFWIGVARNVRLPAGRSLPLLVAIVLSFLSLFFHRFLTPYSANNDFRFIYPVMIPVVLLMIEGTRNIAIGRALCVLFCGLSAAFYLSV